ncbi:hypothetical protein PS627_00484 [Pseudomonas fluorescens]|uniref:hypothetical protein n=1 Tax=Pseudomonas fluorescens TaxID=294 RepID=UPI00125401CE|nr:hypothetical protein [Pseudomonas fluorescens]CAG8863546.1 hypothetical protein PS627_00484 [Pseudomonas fluorescens]VVP84488.1 hypothetical protein PS910_02283 [Pseudomonas fluorescens]
MDQFHAYAIALQEQLVILRLKRDRLKEDGEFLRYHRMAQIISDIEQVLDNLAPGLKPPTMH